MSCNITVHHFLPVASPSPTSTALSLQHARDLAFACSDKHRWVTPSSTLDSSVFTLHHDKLYQYRLRPPPISVERKPANIPEWGEPSHPDDTDHLRLHYLQEFESTDFQHLLAHVGAAQAEGSRCAKRPENGTCTDKPAKRPRLENCTILDIIPQPHFVPAPAVRYQPVDIDRIPHYQKASPSPIAPYDAAAVNELLCGRFRRGAWLIPVRGSPPWTGASTAVILDGTQVASRSPSPCLPVSAPQPSSITWTLDAFQHFWSFLASIQQAKHLGPLSLSFRPAPVGSSTTRDTISEPVWDSNHPQQLSWPSGISDVFAADICRAQLESVDFIKVYHDAPYSLSLRNILDAYRYELGDGQVTGRSGASDRKIRILKGARLVFMDESSKAAFLM